MPAKNAAQRAFRNPFGACPVNRDDFELFGFGLWADCLPLGFLAVFDGCRDERMVQAEYTRRRQSV
jgi:hypothetical protein